MKVLQTSLVILCMLLPVLLQGQPELSLPYFHSTLPKTRQVNPPNISASCELYSDGQNLSLFIEVIDHNLRIHPDPRRCDHVEVWFAMPPEAFPTNFNDQLHPEYLYSPAMQTRGIANDSLQEKTRIFSTFPGSCEDINREQFVQSFDYPSPQTIREDSLDLPWPAEIGETDIHYGMVHFGLFPDNRKAIHYNREECQKIEKSLGVKMDSLENWILYHSEIRENNDGYVINVQFPPEALGFVQLPEMKRIRFMVDIAKGNSRAPGGIVLSSSENRQTNKPSTFTQHTFQKPLQTNYTPVPSEFFERIGFYPVFLMGQDEWKPHAMDIDALIIREHENSEALSEIKFLPRLFRYKSGYLGINSVEEFTQRLEYVNKLPQERETYFINNQMIQSERNLVEGDKTNIKNRIFLFPDGSPGAIIRNNSTLHPYGWGECGECLDETISIYHVSARKAEKQLEIHQWNGPEDAFCEIGPFRLEQHYISQIDWIESRGFLVFHLSHHQSSQKVRYIASFSRDGKFLKVEQAR